MGSRRSRPRLNTGPGHGASRSQAFWANPMAQSPRPDVPRNANAPWEGSPAALGSRVDRAARNIIVRPALGDSPVDHQRDHGSGGLVGVVHEWVPTIAPCREPTSSRPTVVVSGLSVRSPTSSSGRGARWVTWRRTHDRQLFSTGERR
jgi:hypothetical protein